MEEKLIYVLDEWLGHDFDEDGVCSFCHQDGAALSRRPGIPLCDGGRREQAVDKAMRQPIGSS